MKTKQTKKDILKEKQKLLKQLPPLGEVVRGTFIKCYLECIRPNCKCHKGKKYRHGPYYRVSYGEKGRIHHIYIPLNMIKTVKKWTENYNKIWQGIEDISKLNIKIIKIIKIV